MARKSDGEPGVQTIWKGLRKIRIAAEALRFADSDTRRSDQTCV
nr:IS4 family transposase [uncultured Duganella sp.]